MEELKHLETPSLSTSSSNKFPATKSKNADLEENNFHGVDEKRHIECCNLCKIHEFVQKGNIRKANEILSTGVMLEVSLSGDCLNSQPTLFYLTGPAIYESWFETVKLIRTYMIRGYDINATCNSLTSHDYWTNRLWISKFTLLHKFVFLDNVELMHCLVENGADVNALTQENYSALHIAVYNRQRRIVSCLLNLGADINAMGCAPLYERTLPPIGLPRLPECSYTSLIIAIGQGDLLMCKLLLEKGAILDDRLELHYSMYRGDAKIVNLILEYLPEISLKDDTIGGVPSLQFFIHHSNWKFDEDIEDLLLAYKERGYDIHSSKSELLIPPMLFSFLSNSFGGQDTAGFNFLIKMKECNVDILHSGNSLLGSLVSNKSEGMHGCCTNKLPCCRYYIQSLIREFANAELCKFENFVYHSGHGDVVELLSKAGAIFPKNFYKSKICSYDPLHHKEINMDTTQAEFINLCARIESSSRGTMSLMELGRIAVRKLTNIRQWINSALIPEELKEFLTFKQECDAMEEKAFFEPELDQNDVSEEED